MAYISCSQNGTKPPPPFVSLFVMLLHSQTAHCFPVVVGRPTTTPRYTSYGLFQMLDWCASVLAISCATLQPPLTLSRCSLAAPHLLQIFAVFGGLLTSCTLTNLCAKCHPQWVCHSSKSNPHDAFVTMWATLPLEWFEIAHMSSSSGSAGIIMASLSFTNFTTFSCTTVSVLVTELSPVGLLFPIVSSDATSFPEAADSPADFFIFAGIWDNASSNVSQHRRRSPSPQETDCRHVQSLPCVVHGSASPGGMACDLVTDISFPSTYHLGFAHSGPVVLHHTFEQHGLAVFHGVLRKGSQG